MTDTKILIAWPARYKLHCDASCVQKHEVHDMTANALRAKSKNNILVLCNWEWFFADLSETLSEYSTSEWFSPDLYGTLSEYST